MEYSPMLKSAAAQLADSKKQLDLTILNLPTTLNGRTREDSIAKLNDEHEIRCASVKHAYDRSVTWTQEKSFQSDSNQFRQFLELPIVLQNLIWALALPGPRIVPILYKIKSKGLMSPCAIPTMLQVCQGSRKVALSSGYELAFATSKQAPSIYFNFAIDTAYFEDVELLCNTSGMIVAREYASLQSVPKIRRLAVGLEPLVRPPSTRNSHASIAFEKGLFKGDRFRDLQSVILAPFVTYEWLRYGEIDPSEFLQYLIPLLGRHAYSWKAPGQSDKGHGGLTGLENVEVSLLTNAKLYPWMTRRVQVNWDEAIKHNSQKKLEYQLDSEQVIAVARANMSVFDEFAKMWDAKFVEKAWREYRTLQPDSVQHSDFAKLKDPLWQRVKSYPIRYLERPLSNDEIDAEDEERRHVEKLRSDALRVMATRDGPPPPGTLRVGPAPKYKQIRFA